MAKFESLKERHPGLIGLIEIDASGEILSAHGDGAEALGGVLSYVRQMAELMGDSLGFDAFEEAELNGKTTSSFCIPKGDTTLGVISNHRTKISDILPHVE